MAFRPGMKVVCIAAATDANLDGEVDAVVGRIYTVHDLVRSCGDVGLFLEEIRNPRVLTWVGLVERAMYAARFRPVVKRKTDISALKALLVPSTKIREDA